MTGCVSFKSSLVLGAYLEGCIVVDGPLRCGQAGNLLICRPACRLQAARLLLAAFVSYEVSSTAIHVGNCIPKGSAAAGARLGNVFSCNASWRSCASLGRDLRIVCCCCCVWNRCIRICRIARLHVNCCVAPWRCGAAAAASHERGTLQWAKHLPSIFSAPQLARRNLLSQCYGSRLSVKSCRH